MLIRLAIKLTLFMLFFSWAVAEINIFIPGSKEKIFKYMAEMDFPTHQDLLNLKVDGFEGAGKDIDSFLKKIQQANKLADGSEDSANEDSKAMHKTGLEQLSKLDQAKLAEFKETIFGKQSLSEALQDLN